MTFDASRGSLSHSPGTRARRVRFGRTAACLLAAGLALIVAAGSAAADDITPPKLTSAVVNGSTLTLTFDENLASVVTTDTGLLWRFYVDGFTDTGAYWTGVVPDRISINSATVTLHMALDYVGGRNVTVNYARHSDHNQAAEAKLRDANGNEVESFRQVATNNSPVPPGPWVESAKVSGSALTLTFNRALVDSETAGNAFRVRASAPDISVRYIQGTGTASIAGAKVQVTLSEAVGERDLAWVYYEKPDSNPLRDTSSKEAADISRVRVTVLDATPPKLVGGSIDGTSVALHFSERLDGTGTPGAGQFTVTGGTTDLGPVTGVDVDGVSVTMTTATAAVAGQTVTVSVSGTSGIRDLAGNRATAPAAAVGLANLLDADPGAPALAATDPVVVDGAELTLTYDQDLDASSVPKPAAFTFLGLRAASAVKFEGARVILHLVNPVFPCPSSSFDPKLTYDPRKAGSPLQNLHGTDAPAFTDKALAHARTCVTSAVTGSASGSGGKMALAFDRRLNRNAPPDAAHFAVGVAAAAVESAKIPADDDMAVELTLSRALAAGETATVSYTRPHDAAGLRDADGNQLADFSVAVVNGTPLTASFHGLPASHDGAKRFEFELRFSEEVPGLKLTAVERALRVTGGRAVAVKRAVAGQIGRVTVQVRPDSAGDVTVVLAAPVDCSAADAICAGDGRKLSEAVSATVAGPASSNVGDTTPPGLVRATASAGYGFRGARWMLSLNYNQALDRTSIPATGDFIVEVDGSSRAVSEVIVQSSGDVLLFMRSSLWKGQAVTLSYSAGNNPIQDDAGNDAPSFTDKAMIVDDDHLPPRPDTAPPPSGSQPVAAAEVNSRVVDPGASVTLDASGSSDPDGDSLTFAWAQVWGRGDVGSGDGVLGWADEVVLTGADTERATFVAPLNPGVLHFHLTVADSSGRADGAEVIMQVRDLVPDFGDASVKAMTLTPGEAMEPLVLPEATGGNGELTYVLTSEPAGLAGLSFDPARRAISGTPTTTGTWTVTYTAADADNKTGGGDTARLTFTIQVSGAANSASDLTASFHGLPASHDGRRLFGFEIRFGEEVAGLTLTAVERALSVTGGRLLDVKRTVRGKNGSLTVKVRPAGTGAMTLALAAATDCSATGAICAKGGRKLAAVSATVPGPAVNALATGLPAISGTAQVGGTLTASTAGIADADGLTNAAFAYQWVAVRDGTGTDIAGAPTSTYTLRDADAGAAIRVRVSFTDDAGNAETLTSAATASVALPPLTAEFLRMPAEHDGSRRFEFEIRFGEEVAGLRLTAVEAALSVTNGRVVATRRAVAGENRRVTVQVRPDGVDDVTVALPAATDCSASGALCAPDGRKLVSALTATVRGPVAISVADARASEGSDAAVEFAATLNRAASVTVTVDYATRDGTAAAGEDYTFTRGTLSFAAGELEKTVSVPILDDAVDEGEEVFTLKLTNPRGAAIGDGEATGTIENSDPLQTMWLSRFGRTVAGHVADAVSDRLAKPLTGAQVTVGGQTVDLAETDDAAFLGRTLTSLARVMGAPQRPAPAGDGWPGSGSPATESGPGGWPETDLGFRESPHLAGAPMRDLSGRELLLGSTFHLAMEGDGAGPEFAAWGRVTVGGFDGEAPADAGNVSIDGNVTTGVLGADAEWKRLLAGVAVSMSEGEGTFNQPGVDSGTIESSMTTVSPYARVGVTDRISVWGLAGWSTGEMTIVQAANDRGQPERTTQADLAMRLAALGGRGALIEADESGGIDLALKADAFWMETESEPVSNEGTTAANASRLRLALEGSRSFATGGGGVFTPGVELGLRHDGGDAETGTGVELGGRVSWTDPETGLGVDARTRALIAHETSDYGEWGASGAVRLAPGELGRGLSFSLSPTWGTASSGVDRLWGARDARGLAPDGAFVAEQRLEGELGYGLGLFGGRITGTPNAGFGLSDTARELRIGWRLTSVVPGDPGFAVTLDARQRETANGSEPSERGVMLRGAIHW